MNSSELQAAEDRRREQLEASSAAAPFADGDVIAAVISKYGPEGTYTITGQAHVKVGFPGLLWVGTNIVWYEDALAPGVESVTLIGGRP